MSVINEGRTRKTDAENGSVPKRRRAAPRSASAKGSVQREGGSMSETESIEILSDAGEVLASSPLHN
jgi:hypothetical protein